MADDVLRVEFRVALGNRRLLAKPEPGANVERQRQDRAARRARNVALAHYIDHLIRSGEVADLAAVARMCGVSRARVSNVVSLIGTAAHEQVRLADASPPEPLRKSADRFLPI